MDDADAVPQEKIVPLDVQWDVAMPCEMNVVKVGKRLSDKINLCPLSANCSRRIAGIWG